jgi:hypothetical protein
MAAHVRSIVSIQASVEVVVLHTTLTETIQALKAAAELAHGLSARIRLLVLEVAPYPLPLDQPNVPLAFTQRRFRTLADHAAIETNVDIHFVRDREVSINSILEPHSIVVIGGHQTWWPTAQSRLARYLERIGHQIVFA